MKLIMNNPEKYRKDIEENVFLHTCNGRASTFDRMGDGCGSIYTVLTADRQIEIYAGISCYALFAMI